MPVRVRLTIYVFRDKWYKIKRLKHFVFTRDNRYSVVMFYCLVNQLVYGYVTPPTFGQVI